MVNSLSNISKQIDREIIMPLRLQTVGRKLIPRNDMLSGKGIGMQQVEYYTFGDLSAALMDYQLPEMDEDTIDFTTNTAKMVYMKKAFNIPRTAYESYKLQGMPVDTDAAVAVADLIAVAEDSLMINGWAPDGTTYKVNGLYKAANNTEGTTNDFGTNGKAVAELALAFAVLKADNVVGPYNMTLASVQYNQLLGSYSSGGISEWDQVMKMLNINQPTQVGQIWESTNLTAGTGMLTAIGKKYFDYVEAQPIKSELGVDSAHPDTGPIKGTLYEAIVPRIKQTNAICTLTGI